MNSKIVLTKKKVAIIEQHALKDFPNECCGFLFGRIENGKFIDLVMPVTNSKKGDQRRRFEIAPLAYVQAEQYALDNHSNLLGIYHSHPNHPAIPSEYDLANALPFFSYLIISVNEGIIAELTSWKLMEGKRKFVEEEVVIILDSF